MIYFLLSRILNGLGKHSRPPAVIFLFMLGLVLFWWQVVGVSGLWVIFAPVLTFLALGVVLKVATERSSRRR